MESTAPVTVFRTNDPGLLAVAESLLTAADIDYIVHGEALQGLFPLSHHGAQFTPEIQVAADDADEARELLSDLEPVRPTP